MNNLIRAYLLLLILSISYGLVATDEDRLGASPQIMATGEEQMKVYLKENWEVKIADDKQFNIFKQVEPFIKNKMKTTGLVVVQHGKIIYQYGNIEKVSYLASCRKSVLAMLYGKYVTNGTINLNSTLEELGIDDDPALLPIEKKAKVLDLITARSGVYHRAANSGDATEFAPARGSKEPGSYFLYNNWDFNAAGTVFEKLTGKSIYDALEEDLAKPIGMQDFKRKSQKKYGNGKSDHKAYHMYFSTRDMARLGYLMLREGNWDGIQVISREWVTKITSVSTPREEMNPAVERNGRFSYGYMWWIYDNPLLSKAYEGAYIAQGSYGQFILVVPKLDLVIAHKTKPGLFGRRTVNFHEMADQIVLGLWKISQQNQADLEKKETTYFKFYAGTYRDINSKQELKILPEADSLFAESKQDGKFRLMPAYDYNYYRVGVPDYCVKFIISQAGKVTGFTLTNGDSLTEYKKCDKQNSINIDKRVNSKKLFIHKGDQNRCR